MVRNITIGIVLAVAAWAAFACGSGADPQPEISCTSSADCPMQQECQNGACVAIVTCQSDATCSSGYVCMDGTCEVGTSCMATNDCPAGTYCVSGLCHQQTATDGDSTVNACDKCPTGTHCSTDSNTCVSNGTPDGDTETAEVAEPDATEQDSESVDDDSDVLDYAHLCEACATSGDCGAGGANICMEDTHGVKRCARACSASVACPPGYVCTTIGGTSEQCLPEGGACPNDTEEDGDTDSEGTTEAPFCSGYTGADICCRVGDPCHLAGNGQCECESKCSWDTTDCTPVSTDGDTEQDTERDTDTEADTDGDTAGSICAGYTGTYTSCCRTGNPCGWANDSVCDCGGKCAWEASDCATNTDGDTDADSDTGTDVIERCAFEYSTSVTVNPHAGSCSSGACLGGYLGPDDSDETPCSADSDCASSFGSLGVCTNGYCGMSFCAPSCSANSDCTAMADPIIGPSCCKTISGGGKYCFPAEFCFLQTLNGDCSYQHDDNTILNPGTGQCAGTNTTCLGMWSSEDTCSADSTCTSLFGSGGDCVSGSCGTSFCSKTCTSNSNCTSSFGSGACCATIGDGTKWCMPSKLCTSKSGDPEWW